MQFQEGRKLTNGIIAGNTNSGGGTYRDIVRTLAAEVKKEFGLKVRLPQIERPYSTVSVRPGSRSEAFRAGDSGTVVVVLSQIGEIRFGTLSHEQMRIGGVDWRWLYLPPGMRYHYRASHGFANDFVLIQANLTVDMS